MRPVKRDVISYLESYVKERPNHVYLFTETVQYTSTDVYNKTKACAAFLKAKGVGAGDYVGISGTRSIQAVIFFLATQYLGAVAVMFDPHSSIPQCQKELGVDIPLKLALESDGDGFVVDGTPVDFDAINGDLERQPIDLYAPALIIFTSGSTGRSKGVMHSQYSYVNHQRNYHAVAGHQRNDSFLHMLPIFHAFGMVCIIDSILRRIPVFFPKHLTAEYILESIEKYKVTRVGFVPTFALMLADLKHEKKYNTDSLRALVLAGAPTTAEQFMYIQNALGGKILPVYGMSEIVGISGAGPVETDEKRAGSVGRVMPMTRVQIAPDGEITVKGPSLFMGYYGEEPVNRRKFFHTGDLGHIDDEGFLHITGRKKDIIIRNGNNLAPLEIEEKLMKLPFIKSAAVVGIKDDKAGEIPVAMVVLEKGAAYDADAIRTVLNKLEMPKEIRIVDALPLNATGKIDKLKIRTMFEE